MVTSVRKCIWWLMGCQGLDPVPHAKQDTHLSVPGPSSHVSRAQWPGRPGIPRTVRHQIPAHNLTSELREGAALAIREPRVPGTALISEGSQEPAHKAAPPWLTTALSPLEIPCALWIRNPMISFCCGPHKSWGPPGQESGLG